jgi:hypothetical protein
MPSPLGEGQTDTPINHVHLGEVSAKMPLAESLLAKHPRREANPTIQMLNLHPKFPLSHLGEMSPSTGEG